MKNKFVGSTLVSNQLKGKIYRAFTGVSLFLSSIVALCLLTVTSSSATILSFEGGFIAIFSVAWTFLILLTIEYYPTHLR